MERPNVSVDELKSVDWKEMVFSAKGRLNRKPYWQLVLVLCVVSLVASIILSLIGLPMVALGLGAVLNLALICPFIKRLHDRNRSGWFALLLFVPILQAWPAIEVGFLRGTVGENKFGSDPLA